jgi:hypothetical protein
MKPLFLTLALLGFGVCPASATVDDFSDFPRALSAERIPVTVVAVVNSFQVIVLVHKPKGYLLG